MYKIYQVEYGDTLDVIAGKTGSTRETIKNINGFNSDADLVVGSLIIVPKEENQVFPVIFSLCSIPVFNYQLYYYIR